MPVFVAEVQQELPFDPDRLAVSLTQFLMRKGIDKQFHLILVDDDYMADLNRRYRKGDGATDVLSFDLGGSELPDDETDGEVYVSLDRAESQAKERNIPMAEEVVRLSVHGLLHLIGYDHEEGGAEEQRMLRETEDGVRHVMEEMDLLH
ncbi:MAG: rRNA maturation RNase YbeY [Candidatus Latescibacterota bacterium]